MKAEGAERSDRMCINLPKVITFHLLSCKIFVDEITLKIQWNQFKYFHAQQIVINKNRYGKEFSLNRMQVVFISKHMTLLTSFTRLFALGRQIGTFKVGFNSCREFGYFQVAKQVFFWLAQS